MYPCVCVPVSAYRLLWPESEENWTCSATNCFLFLPLTFWQLFVISPSLLCFWWLRVIEIELWGGRKTQRLTDTTEVCAYKRFCLVDLKSEVDQLRSFIVQLRRILHSGFKGKPNGAKYCQVRSLNAFLFPLSIMFRLPLMNPQSHFGDNH